jgi:hypothetical protein
MIRAAFLASESLRYILHCIEKIRGSDEETYRMTHPCLTSCRSEKDQWQE